MKKKHEAEVLMECREKLAGGSNTEDIICLLRDAEFSKVDCIKALVYLGQADMRQAKLLVHNSITWADVSERDEEFQRRLEELF